MTQKLAESFLPCSIIQEITRSQIQEEETQTLLLDGKNIKEFGVPVLKHLQVFIGLDVAWKRDQVRKKRGFFLCILFIGEEYLFLQQNSTLVLLPRHGSHVYAKLNPSHRNRK